jgi:hypothetical protein
MNKNKKQECFTLESGTVRLEITQKGAQMAPVTFFNDTANPVQPYYISPWQEDSPEKRAAELEGQPGVLNKLRGDFFCMPFGANPGSDDSGEREVPHGEVAGEDWEFIGKEESRECSRLEMHFNRSRERGSVKGEWLIKERESCIYTRHTIEGAAGRLPLGHHATLGLHNGALKLKSSPLLFGITNPGSPPWNSGGEYYSLAPSAKFSSLEEVPTIWKDPPFTDASRFPNREGYVDILQIVQQAPKDKTPAWMTAWCQEGGYIWFSLKNPSILPSTVIWMENLGRHGAPWNGRNRCIGLEDVCGYLAEGIDASLRNNLLTGEGIPTALDLERDRPLVVPYIQGVVRCDSSFDGVDHLEFSEEGVSFVSPGGKTEWAPVDWQFVFSS